jgi:hypothetical protein
VFDENGNQSRILYLRYKNIHVSTQVLTVCDFFFDIMVAIVLIAIVVFIVAFGQ